MNNVTQFLCLCNFGLIVKVPRTGNVSCPLVRDCTCSPRGSLFFFFLEGSLKEGRAPS